MVPAWRGGGRDKVVMLRGGSDNWGRVVVVREKESAGWTRMGVWGVWVDGGGRII